MNIALINTLKWDKTSLIRLKANFCSRVSQKNIALKRHEKGIKLRVLIFKSYSEVITFE